MNGDDLFTGSGKDAVDQWTFDQTSGAAAALQTHWVRILFASDRSCYRLYQRLPNTIQEKDALNSDSSYINTRVSALNVC